MLNIARLIAQIAPAGQSVWWRNPALVSGLIVGGIILLIILIYVARRLRR